MTTAANHYGIVSRAQAVAAGMTDKQVDNRIANGRWEVIHPSVYRIAGTPITGRQRAYAASLSMDAIVSHTTAGALLRIDGVRARGVHVTLAYGQRGGQKAKGISVHWSTSLPRTDRVFVDRIPCTNGTRTILDLAADLDDERLETAFESARRMGLTTTVALARRFEALGGRGRPGSARVKKLLDVAGERPLESRLEVKLARLLRQAGHIPAVQHKVGDYRLDFAWPFLLLAVECDGFEHHGYRLAWKRDRRRIAALEAMHWRIIHVTWDDVTLRPEETLARIATALVRAA
ncbi:MAG: DUF559 domain-containing protein [Actinomycetota bacterium]|nr:DUF559 domain-containing protein [Actinomycetota bacterium]